MSIGTPRPDLSMSFLHPHLRLASAGALLVAGACSEPVAAPRSAGALPSHAGMAATVATGLPRLIPNAIKYRDRSLKNATGRAGSATITARALLGKDGMVDLEVTTGDLDTRGAPPGNLDKVQVKGLNPTDAAAVWTRNYNRLAGGGYWTTRYAGLAAGSRLQVQANVSGIDPKRVGVVTLVETAKRRPDAAVTSLMAPATAIPGAPIAISATIRELNGDVGARADCRLLVDGAEVDRAEGIWIDAAGIVTCAFTHVFTTSGTQQVTVEVSAASPGDWDTANDAMSQAITIGGAQNFSYFAFMEDMTVDLRSADTVEYTWTQSSGASTSSYWAGSTHEAGRAQSAIHTGHMPKAVPFPLAQLEFSHTTNGQAIWAVGLQEVDRQWDWEESWGTGIQRWTCVDMYATSASTGRLSASLCAMRHFNADGQVTREFSHFAHWRWAGDVTYRSRDFYRYRYQDSASDPVTEYFYDENYEVRTTDGMPLPAIGSTYEMTFSVTGADGRSYGGHAVIPLAPHSSTSGSPYACRDMAATWEGTVQTGTACSGTWNTRTGVSGAVTGGP